MLTMVARSKKESKKTDKATNGQELATITVTMIEAQSLSMTVLAM